MAAAGWTAPRNWESFKPVLRDAGDASTVHLDVIADELRPELAKASKLTESLRAYDTSYHTELNWWTGHFETSDGIPRSALLSAAESDRVPSHRAAGQPSPHRHLDRTGSYAATCDPRRPTPSPERGTPHDAAAPT
jgi:hypothetical protein